MVIIFNFQVIIFIIHVEQNWKFEKTCNSFLELGEIRFFFVKSEYNFMGT